MDDIVDDVTARVHAQCTTTGVATDCYDANARKSLPINITDYVVDDRPSPLLKISMSRRISEKLVVEERLRPFLLQQLRELLPQRSDLANAVRRIEYGKSARKIILVELADVQLAVALREALHNKPCALVTQRALYVEFAVLRKEKEARDAFERVADISRIRALDDPSPRIPGLVILPEFISRDEERALLELVDRDDGAHWKNTVKARQVQHFGYEFSYETRRCDERAPLAPMPPAMAALVAQIPASIMETPDQITVNEYKPGQGIAAHIDTHSAFANAIASLSLANEIVMEFHHPDGRLESVLCQPRSLLVMTGASRYEWTHAIPPRLFDVIDSERVDRKRRVSITFRKVQSTPCTCEFPVQCDSKESRGNGSGSDSDISKQLKLPAVSTGETLFPTHVERQYVHEFYETVASHFSSTRYNPWPRVAAFVRSLEPGSLIADIGCGNGKYMKCVGAQSAVIGGDRSSNLAKICHASDLNVLVCDAMTVPIRSRSCDAALSIAVLHHLSTLHHRLAAVKELVRVLRVGGRGVIYAWAHEQKTNSKRRFDEHKQDFMVPWNLDKRFALPANGVGVASAIAADSSLSEHEQSCGAAVTQESSTTTAMKMQMKTKETGRAPSEPIVVQRYCHMFKEGELEQLVTMAGNALVEEHYYDESNWAVVLRRVS